MKGAKLPKKLRQNSTFCKKDKGNKPKKTPPKGDVDELIFPDGEIPYISER